MNRLFVTIALVLAACGADATTAPALDATGTSDATTRADEMSGPDAASVDISVEVTDGDDGTATPVLCPVHKWCIALECGAVTTANIGLCVAAAKTACAIGDDPESLAAKALAACQVENDCAPNPDVGFECTSTKCATEYADCRTGGTYGVGSCSEYLSCAWACSHVLDGAGCVRDCAIEASLVAHEQYLDTELCLLATCTSYSTFECLDAALAPGGACAPLCP